MKRIFALILSVILMACLYSAPVAAEESVPFYNNAEEIVFSDDLSSVSIGDRAYSRFNINTIVDNTESDPEKVTLTIEQMKIIEYAEVCSNSVRSVLRLDVSYVDGSNLTAYYLADDCRKAYDALMQDNDMECSIDFRWPEGNLVLTQKSKLFGKRTEIDFPSSYDEFCTVSTKSTKGDLVRRHGVVYVDSVEERCYYFDFEELGIQGNATYDLYLLEGQKTACSEITDPELKEQLLEAKEESYSVEFGFFGDSELTENISSFFLVFVFGVLPFALLVVSLVLSIRSKRTYKKIFTCIWLLCASELLVFALLLGFAIIL